MFNESNVKVLSEVKDWEESIKSASEPLIKSGNIEQSYVDAMIKSINDLGFYIILGEHIAMPHARPENGVNETGVSFLKVNKPVDFGDDPISLIFILAAKDSDSHIDTIGALLEIFQDEEKIKDLLKTEDKNELIKILNR